MARARRGGAIGVALIAALAASLASPSAHAQDATAPGFGLQLFRPAIDSKGYVTVNASQVLNHLDLSFGFIGSWAHSVLPLKGAGKLGFDVTNLVTPQLQGAIGFYRWVELGVSVPIHILFGERTPPYVSPDDSNHNNDLTFSGQGIGDLGLHPKIRFLNTSRHPIGLALLTSVYLPTGDDRKFLGEGQVTLRPELILDKEFGSERRFRAAINGGALWRPSTHTFVDNGTTLLKDPGVNGGGPFCQPAPVVGGMAPPPGSCGTGQSRSLGTQLTYSLGLSYSIVPQKFDLVVEGYGYYDVSGAKAGNPIEALGAAKVYLARNSFFQIGGGAGVIPATTQAMTGSPLWRVFVGFIFEPNIGDRDGDGIKDDVDKCPDDPEDFDDFEDEDGCPDPDNDKDGILDKDDLCPNDPEDKDGFEDEDGCPDPDNDKDRILDKDDKCPNEPETYNGFEDEDGCPDKGRVVVRRGKLEILDKIYFETAKAVIKPISFPILNAIVATLKGNPQILLLEIQGHADERGDDDYNMRLTEERAAAVKTYLLEHGVEEQRLQSHGYGETRPVCPQHNEGCWSKNRRSEFVILRRSDNPSPD